MRDQKENVYFKRGLRFWQDVQVFHPLCESQSALCNIWWKILWTLCLLSQISMAICVTLFVVLPFMLMIIPFGFVVLLVDDIRFTILRRICNSRIAAAELCKIATSSIFHSQTVDETNLWTEVIKECSALLKDIQHFLFHFKLLYSLCIMFEVINTICSPTFNGLCCAPTQRPCSWPTAVHWNGMKGLNQQLHLPTHIGRVVGCN